MLMRFWGTRGSIPTPDRRTAYFGGNTSCVELRPADGNLLILDCGTGARPLGLDILGRSSTLPPMHMLVTHTHWDHIQGFPFFLPAYVPESRLTIYGARGLERTLEASLSGQMNQTYFPVQLGELRAEIDFVELSEERFALGEFTVTTQFLNHTAPTIGYRLETGRVKIAYVTDHEPFWWAPCRRDAPAEPLHPGEQRHIGFMAGVDVLIHDAQYSDREYPAKRGWGHSTIEYVTDVAVRAGVKRLVLFHHDPLHSDAWVRQQTERARRRARAMGSHVEILAASEGLEISLPDGTGEAPARAANGSRPAFLAPTGRILLAGSSREGVNEVRDVLSADGYDIVTAADGGLAAAGAKIRPDLLILVGGDGESTLLQSASSLRGEKWATGVPMLVLAGSEGPGASGRLVDGLTDVVSRPLNPAVLRPRVRAWLARAGTTTTVRSAPRRHRMVSTPTLSARSLLHGLPFPGPAALMTGVLASRFRAGDVLFRQGDPAGGLYVIRSGRVRISVKDRRGREIVLGTATAGDTVGELAALDGGPRTATVRAIEPTAAEYVPREIFEAGLSSAPESAVRLLRLMAQRLRNTDRFVGELAVTTPAATPGRRPRAGRKRTSTRAVRARD